MAAELVRSNVQVIAAQNPSAALAAQKATRDIPIVFMSISDPLALGLVRDLARPGANITGVANTPYDLNRKRIEVLKDGLPGLRRIAILARAGNPNSHIHLAGEVVAARQLGMEARIHEISGASEFASAFAAMGREGSQAVVVVQDSLWYAAREQLTAQALAYRLPVIADGVDYADSGVLFMYGPNYRNTYVRGAAYVDRILKGTPPGELPVDQPLDLRLVVNLKVARALGIEPSPSLLARANQIIE
jgi:putative ABC transport system substrate-binding protein